MRIRHLHLYADPDPVEPLNTVQHGSGPEKLTLTMPHKVFENVGR